jgi:hypothetical protein
LSYLRVAREPEVIMTSVLPVTDQGVYLTEAKSVKVGDSHLNMNTSLWVLFLI